MELRNELTKLMRNKSGNKRERRRRVGKKMMGNGNTGGERNLKELKSVIIVGKGEQVQRQVGLKLDEDMEKGKLFALCSNKKLMYKSCHIDFPRYHFLMSQTTHLTITLCIT